MNSANVKDAEMGSTMVPILVSGNTHSLIDRGLIDDRML